MMEQRLQSGLAALNLPVEGIPALVRYGDLLIETNKVMNLTAITDPEDVATLHFLDSAALLTLALSVLAALRSEHNFLWAWSAMLLAAFPSGLFLSFARTFQRQSTRLYRYGAALSGWSGARVLSGECAVTITDQDLFPAGSVTLNGMKIYSDRSVSQIIGFANAVVSPAMDFRADESDIIGLSQKAFKHLGASMMI